QHFCRLRGRPARQPDDRGRCRSGGRAPGQLAHHPGRGAALRPAHEQVLSEPRALRQHVVGLDPDRARRAGARGQAAHGRPAAVLRARGWLQLGQRNGEVVGPMLAFLFPGQGSQKAGMGNDLADDFLLARQVFAAADDARGWKLSKLCFEGPESELVLTANQQPAILTASIAAMRVYEKELGVNPDAAAGHSLGEYSALVCAGALGLQDAVRMVHLRGQFMQEATPPGTGAMGAVVGLDARTVEDTCLEAAAGEVCAPANWNGGGQVVIAGHKAAVERAMALCKQKGAQLVKALAVSAPFHCAL